MTFWTLLPTEAVSVLLSGWAVVVNVALVSSLVYSPIDKIAESLKKQNPGCYGESN